MAPVVTDFGSPVSIVLPATVLWLRKMELEQGCTAPECQLFSQQRVVEYFNHRPADDKVLLYLVALRPRGCLLPF